MKRMSMVFFLLVMLVATSGCFHNRIVTSPNYNAAKSQEDYSAMQIHILGLIPTTEVTLNEVCQTEAGVVETKTYISLFFLTFSNLKVYCTAS